MTDAKGELVRRHSQKPRCVLLPLPTAAQVVRVSSWASPGDKKDDKIKLTSARGGGNDATQAATLLSTPQKQKQLHRQAFLEYDVSSPFGSSEAKAVQSIALSVDGGTITYSEASCVSGFPMMAGDLKGKTTWAVTPSVDDPGRCVVRVAVSIDAVVLPLAVRWLEGRIGKMMRKDLIASAQKYLDAMARAEAEEDRRYEEGRAALCQEFASAMDI